MQEFLNPKSMLTPGVAGSTMMFLVNGLCVPFPELPPRYVALALSFVIGAVVFRAEKLGYVERAVFWVLNSLVIFVVGFGTATLGHDATATPATRVAGMTMPAPERVAIPALIASASAAEAPKAPAPAKPAAGAGMAAEAARAAAEAEKLRLELEALRLENERLKQAAEAKKATPTPATEQRQFFRKW